MEDSCGFGLAIYEHSDSHTHHIFHLPVNLATPLNVISSMIVGSDRPLAFTANRMIRYDEPGSKLSIKKFTGALWNGRKKGNDYHKYVFVQIMLLKSH